MSASFQAVGTRLELFVDGGHRYTVHTTANHAEAFAAEANEALRVAEKRAERLEARIKEWESTYQAEKEHAAYQMQRAADAIRERYEAREDNARLAALYNLTEAKLAASQALVRSLLERVKGWPGAIRTYADLHSEPRERFIALQEAADLIQKAVAALAESPAQAPELDSPDSVPQALKDFAARGYERINRGAQVAPEPEADLDRATAQAEERLQAIKAKRGASPSSPAASKERT